MKLFRNEPTYKEVFEIERERVKKLRDELDFKEVQLAVTDSAAISILRLYGVEAVDKYKEEIRASGLFN